MPAWRRFLCRWLGGWPCCGQGRAARWRSREQRGKIRPASCQSRQPSRHTSVSVAMRPSAIQIRMISAVAGPYCPPAAGRTYQVPPRPTDRPRPPRRPPAAGRAGPCASKRGRLARWIWQVRLASRLWGGHLACGPRCGRDARAHRPRHAAAFGNSGECFPRVFEFWCHKLGKSPSAPPETP